MRDNIEKSHAENSSEGVTRRNFVKYFVAGSALSLSGLSKANAAIYQSLTSLNQKYLEDDSPDGAYWNALKKSYLFEDGLIMMNCGTVGPMPQPVFNTLTRTFRTQVVNPYDVYNFLPEKEEEVRAKLAKFINASPDEVAITGNSTEGIVTIVNGLDLKEGDEVLISNMEHPATLRPWKLKEMRCGIKVKQVPLGLPPKSVSDIVDAFAKEITAKTKVISVSHTIFISGLVTPLKELSKVAHEKGILVLADSAHGLGMLDLDVEDLGIDFLVSSPYKWLGSPTGIGLLYVKTSAQDGVWPTIVGARGDWTTMKGARKFDPSGQRADAFLYALDEALDFQNIIGKDRIERRIKTLAGYLKRELGKIPGVKLNTSDDPSLSAGLTAFSLDGVDPETILNYVREKYNIVVRTVGTKAAGTSALRVSTPTYISYPEIDLFLEGVKHLSLRRA